MNTIGTEERVDAINTMPDLSQLEADIQASLRGRVRAFSLQYHEEGLVLSGESDYFYHKQLALNMVQQETDLPIRRNLIVVKDNS